MNYSLAYRIGFHPWEDAEVQPSAAGRSRLPSPDGM
jgi:hypothetical protein